MWITNWLAAAGLTTMLLEAPGQAAAGELERDGLGRVVGQAGERGHAARDGDRGRPLERAGAALERRRHHRAVVAGLQVAVLVLFVDDRLSAERPPAVAVDDGWVWITNWLAAAGLTTMLLDVASVRPPRS